MNAYMTMMALIFFAVGCVGAGIASKGISNLAHFNATQEASE